MDLIARYPLAVDQADPWRALSRRTATPIRAWWGRPSRFAAQGAGATLVEHTEITEGWYANGAFQLRAADNRTFAAPVLVNCAGAWAGKVAGWFDEAVTLVPEIPQVQVTEPLPYRIEPVLGFVGGDFYLRQTLRGNILFGSGQGRASAGHPA